MAEIPAGSFALGQFRNASGTRTYRLYRPMLAPASGQRAPLLLMLHGCSQDAEHFAAATRMASHADALGCWLLFPQQSATAQRGRCWQWFERSQQQRGSGEPAILAGMVRKAVRMHGLDGRRVFVAGLSAGAAMAVILGRTYPDLFRGVGAYAGLPYAAARTAATALLAMRGRLPPGADDEDKLSASRRPVRTIVFQGDRDRVVAPRNADEIVSQALRGFGPTQIHHDEGTVANRDFQRVRHVTAAGQIAVEHWTLAGAGHAWSGGAAGTYSDTRGPDASAAMLRFFLNPTG